MEGFYQGMLFQPSELHFVTKNHLNRRPGLEVLGNLTRTTYKNSLSFINGIIESKFQSTNLEESSGVRLKSGREVCQVSGDFLDHPSAHLRVPNRFRSVVFAYDRTRRNMENREKY